MQHAWFDMFVVITQDILKRKVTTHSPKVTFAVYNIEFKEE